MIDKVQNKKYYNKTQGGELQIQVITDKRMQNIQYPYQIEKKTFLEKRFARPGKVTNFKKLVRLYMI